ncbi:transglutaminase-like cysteine peptidase [Phenylobacterium sp.]|uniref:transglutaminase-like cysteine peptidase n=1 Tax=Phenylobacterium sp. TaxID=1871053 RepID=UPI00391C8317
MSASACLAAPAAATMPLGRAALPPAGYVAFCQRQPLDCGADAAQVLAGARRAEADRKALLAPAAVGRAEPAGDVTPAPLLFTAVIEAAEAPVSVSFVDPTWRASARRSAIPRLDPALWTTLNRVNGRVNQNLLRRTDADAWGADDYWATPLRDGLSAGDCEDFVLEKRRALLDAGVPARALNIAVATTAWGETHAVLLVNTSKGEFVLDNLTPWIVPWKSAPYHWRQRQVGGEAFNWVMAAPAAKSRRGQGVLIATLR